MQFLFSVFLLVRPYNDRRMISHGSIITTQDLSIQLYIEKNPGLVFYTRITQFIVFCLLLLLLFET